MFVLVVTVVYTIWVTKIFLATDNQYFYTMISFLTSIGFYELLIKIIYFFVGKFEILRKMYWGNLYLDGLWYYTYTLNGEKRYGYWKISQDLYSVKVIGCGFNKDGTPRSDVQSVTDLIKNDNSYEIVNKRRDDIANTEYDTYFFSKTTLILNNPPKKKWSLIKYSMEMHGATIIYGGKLSGVEHRDVMFVKKEDVATETELIQYVVSEIREGRL